MLSAVQLFLSLLLLLAFSSLIASDVVTHSALMSAVYQALNFLQSHNLTIWRLLTGLILAVSQGLRTVVLNVSRTPLDLLHLGLDRWLGQSDIIRELQQELNAQYSPTHVQTLYDTISSLKRQHEESESRCLRMNTEVKTLLSACSLKTQHIKRLEEEVRALTNDQSAGAVQAREYIAHSEILKFRNENAGLKKEINELEGKLLRSQRRLAGENRTTHDRQHNTDLRKMQEELDQQAEIITELRSTPAIRTSESKLDPLRIMTSTLQQLTNDADERFHVVAVLFVAGLHQFGADLAALNIDAEQFQACLAWARVVFSNWTLTTDTGGTEPGSLLARNVSPDQIIGTAGQPKETIRNAGVIVAKQHGLCSINVPSSIAGNSSVSLPVANHRLNRRSGPSGNVTDLERLTRYGAVTKLRLPRHSTISCTALARLSVDLSAL